MNELEFSNIVGHIMDERKRQNTLHPEWKGDLHGLAVLMEEVGEVAYAINEHDIANLKEELVQVAAVCFRFLENIK